jgi:2-polyprenyl-3-methyl-5-hydroxy-6-metoxy-1,4-benzoquinol methylase
MADKPRADDLRKYYASTYYQEAQGAYSFQYTNEEKNWISAKLEQRHAVLRKICPEAGSLLDVGCGEGFALALPKQRLASQGFRL